MVRVLGSRSSGPGSNPGWGTRLCYWARHSQCLSLPSYANETKIYAVNLMLGLLTLR